MVNISSSGRSKVFLLEGHYGKKTWESHAFYLGSWDSINLEVQKASIGSNLNATCDPIVDAFLIKGVGSPIGCSDNLLVYNGFEVGPAFPQNFMEGILLDEEPEELESPLQQWPIIGTVEYIDCKHYSVPQGKAAIELVSVAPSGILTSPILTKDSTYKLEFTIVDANNSCTGDFIVYVQAGTHIQNFTMQSQGTGSAQNYSMMFKADSSLTPISFVSFNESQTSDHFSCGPAIDHVVLHSNYALRQMKQYGLAVTSLVFSLVLLIFG